VRAGKRPVQIGLARAAGALWPELEADYIADIRELLHTPAPPTVSADE
jgi:hypothetical protein